MTESEFNECVYLHYTELYGYLDTCKHIDKFDMLCIAAMRCAMDVDRDGVRKFCDKEKPLLEKYKLQKYQFTSMKKIALKNKNVKTVDINALLELFFAKIEK